MNNIAQSNPEGELERLGGVREFRGPDELGQGGEELREGAGGVSDEGEEKNKAKKSKKWPIVMMVLVVLAAIGGGVAWWMLEGKSGGNVAVEDEGTADNEVDIEVDDEKKDDGAIEGMELGLDDSVVQKVFGYLFQGSGGYGVDRLNYLGQMLGNDADLTDFMMLQYFMYRDDMSMVCRGTRQEKNELLPVDLDDGFDDGSLQDCRYGEDLRDKVKALFGKKLALADMPERIGWWYYDKNNDEYIYQCRGIGELTFVPENKVVLYRAEAKGDEVYLYLAGAQLFDACGVGDEVGCSRNEWYVLPVGVSIGFGEFNVREVYGEYIVSGGLLGLNKGDEERYTDEFYEYVKDNKERLGDYKVTFAKNGEGDYIYQSVEEIK